MDLSVSHLRHAPGHSSWPGAGRGAKEGVVFNLFHIGLKGWFYMSDSERQMNELIADGLELPGHIVEVAERWHGGQSSMLYAICSTGGIKRGSVRPERTMSDGEWMLSLLDEASSELRDAACHCEQTDDENYADHETLIEAAELIEAKANELRELVEDYEDFDPVRDGWIGKDGRP